jgi:archaellum biogenesis protein FlaJ (TadC family)
MGRKKSERPVDGNVARKIKARIHAEDKWVRVVELATKKAELTLNTADLRNALEYLDNRDLGNTMDTVNHLHDKPLEMNVNVKISEIIRGVRERKRNYERSGK